MCIACVILTTSLSAYAGPNEDLFRGVAEKKAALVRAALKNRASINARDGEGNTPLIAAYAQNRKEPEIIRLLLSHRPDINAQNKKGTTALIAGVQNLDTERSRLGFIDLLLKARANVNIKDNEGKSAFYYAARGTDDVLCILLAGRGADVNVRDSDGLTPYMYYPGNLSLTGSLRGGMLNILNTINYDPNVKDAKGMTLLMHAVKADNPEITGIVLKKRPRLNEKDKEGFTALHRAVCLQRNRGAVTKALIDAGADVNAKTNEGKTPIMLAVRGGAGEVVDMLIAARAQLSIKDNDGNDVMAHAKIRNELSMIRRLEGAGLKSGVDTRSSDDDFLCDASGNFLRDDLYQKALEDGNLEMVKKCVDKGARLDVMLGGKTPLAIAIEKGHTAVADYLRSRGAVESAPAKEGRPHRK
jgi:ankyrin repeat protein